MKESVCTGCGRSGQPYEYRGIQFNGLTVCRNEELCESCLGSYVIQSGVDVHFSWFGQEDVINTRDMKEMFPGSRFGFHLRLKPRRKKK